MACCVDIGDGKHLSAGEALALLNPNEPLHELYLQQVANEVPEDVLADFRQLRSMSEVDRMKLVESAINRVWLEIFKQESVESRKKEIETGSSDLLDEEGT